MKKHEIKIKKLKDLSIAHIVSLRYDHIPSPDSIDEVFDNVFANCDKGRLASILEEYQGKSKLTIECFIILGINEL